MSLLRLFGLTQETTFSLSDFVMKVKAGGAGDVIVKQSDYLNAIFSGSLTTYANPGSAGGTFYYINLGGIKLFWGTTNTLTTSGSGSVSANGNVTLPTGFFTTLQMVSPSIQVPVSSQYLSTALGSITGTTSVNVQVNQWTGTNGGAPVNLFIIGT